MPGPNDPVSAERVAALVAPMIDRLRNAIVQALRIRGDEIVGEFCVGEPALVTRGPAPSW